MSLLGSKYFTFPADLDNVITEIKKGHAVYVNVDLGNGTVTDLVLMLLPDRRFLVGRRNYGGCIVECIDDLTYMLIDAQNGTNELKLQRADSAYLIPSLLVMFTQIGGDVHKERKPVPYFMAPTSRPHISLFETPDLFDINIKNLVKHAAEQNVIEFEVACNALGNDDNSAAENHEIYDGDMNVYIVVVSRRFALGDVHTYQVNDGFCAVICDVGSWAWKSKESCYPVDDHYLIEKLSLWNMQGSPVEIQNLCTILRALSQ